MQKGLSIVIMLIGIALFAACSSSNKLVLKVEKQPEMEKTASLHPPVHIGQIANIDDVGYKAKLTYYNGRLFIGNLDGEIYIVDPQKESKREIIDLKEPIESQIYVKDNFLYAGTTKGVLYKIDYRKKRIEKKAYFDFPVMKNIYEKDGRLYVITEDDSIKCLNPNDLSLIWSYSNGEANILDIRSTSGILFKKDGMYTGFSDGSIAKISYKGEQIWTSQAGDGNMFIDSDATPEGDQTIFATSVNGYTEALSPSDGSVLWKRKISSYSNMEKNIFGLFTADENGNIIALDNDNGETIWKKKVTKDSNIYTISLVDKYIFALTNNGTLIVLDALRGKVMDIKNIGGDFSCNFTPGSNKLYAISRDGTIYEISNKK